MHRSLLVNHNKTKSQMFNFYFLRHSFGTLTSTVMIGDDCLASGEKYTDKNFVFV